jgi:arginine deiminase
MDSNGINVSVNSEIGKLQHVLVHTPGFELENMTPEDAHVYLFSDLLNVQVAQKEYGYFKRVLQKVAKVHEVKDLLAETLQNENIKYALIDRICKAEDKAFLNAYLKSLEPKELSRQLIEGVHLKDITYINKEKYALLPLPNLFFMRDASLSMYDSILISNMASPVRARECMILETIYNFHPMIEAKVINPVLKYDIHGIGTVEGGDVQIIRDDIIICGLGSRTNMHGVEALVEHLKTRPGIKHLIFQELPLKPESFIHLDMVFTMLDVNKCMAYKPVIMNNAFKTFHITIDGQKAIGKDAPNLLAALNDAGLDLEPVFCGGGDENYGAREQWHSGCNFFCLAPGQFLGYGRNQHTLQALNDAGFNVVTAADVVNGKINLDTYHKCVVAFEGNELSRGGGGARCMTMPLQRMPVDW